jgi:hypothetical protein
MTLIVTKTCHPGVIVHMVVRLSLTLLVVGNNCRPPLAAGLGGGPRDIIMMYHGSTVPKPRHLWHVNSTTPPLLPLQQELGLCDIVLAWRGMMVVVGVV